MRENDYNSLEEFMGEYEYPKTGNYDRCYGLDFRYNKVSYRLGLIDYVEGGKKRREFEEMLGHSLDDYLYEVMIVNYTVPITPYISDQYNFIGWYKDMDDLLENCYIQGRKFKDVIMDDSTSIDGKD